MANHKRIRECDDDDADTPTITAASVTAVFQNYALIHVNVMRFLPTLSDRARLACVTPKMRRYCMRHDAVLLQMWTTWAVPNLSNNVRHALLLPSGIMACIRWAWEHDAKTASKSEAYAVSLSKIGHVEGIVFALSHVTDVFERRQLLVQSVMHVFHAHKADGAIQLYENHVLPLKPTAADIRLCIMASLYMCSAAIEARIMSWKPGMRVAELRTLGLMLSLHCNNPAIGEYHWKAIGNAEDAVRAMSCAVVTEGVNPDEFMTHLAKTKARAAAAGIPSDDFLRPWIAGMHLTPETIVIGQ